MTPISAERPKNSTEPAKVVSKIGKLLFAAASHKLLLNVQAFPSWIS